MLERERGVGEQRLLAQSVEVRGPVAQEGHPSFPARAGGPAWVATVSRDEATGRSPPGLQGSPTGQPGAGAQPEVEDALPPAAPHRGRTDCGFWNLEAGMAA